MNPSTLMSQAPHETTPLAGAAASGTVFTLRVKESGCNGYMYTLDFLDELQTDDIQVDIGDNINICIRRDDLPWWRHRGRHGD